MFDVIPWAIEMSVRIPLLGDVVMLLLKTSGILALTGFFAAALARASAAKRHMVWTAGIVGAVLIPLVTLTLPQWRIPVQYNVTVTEIAPPAVVVQPPSFDAPTAAAPVVADDGAPESSGPVVAPNELTLQTAPSQLPSQISTTLVFLAVWALGALIVLLPWFAGLVTRTRLANGATDLLPGPWERALRTLRVQLFVPARVRVLASPECGTPMTWGVLRPIVLVPQDTSWTDNERRNALLHEFAHVRRGDYIAKLLARILCAMYWFNPLAWMAARAERLTREQACDDAVLRAGSRASSYAQQLLDVAYGNPRSPLAAAALTMARPSSLAQRLRSILDGTHDRSPSGRLLSSATVIAACALVPPLATMSPEWTGVTVAVPRAETPNEEVREVQPPSSIHASAPASVAGASVVDAPALPGTPFISAVPISSGAPLVSGPAASLVALQGTNCTPANSKKSSTSISHNDNGSPDRRRWQVKWSDGTCRIELDARGTFTLSPNADDIVAITPRGYVEIEQDDGRSERRVRITRENGDGLTRTYWVNGERRAWDADAAAWFARIIVQLDGRTAFAVDARLPLLLQRGGVDGVIAEVATFPSSYAQRVYYSKLFTRATVSTEQITRILQNAARTFDSGYDKAELLLLVAKQSAFAEPAHLAYAQMARDIDSDYEKRRALGGLLSRSDLKPAIVQTMLAATDRMESDYELAELLLGIDRRYAVDESTRPFYVRALSTIQSDYEQRRVLSAIMRGGNLGPAVTGEIVQIAGSSMKGYELAEFLVSVASKGALDAANSGTFFEAAKNVGSDYERGRVMNALITKGQLTPAVVEGIIGTAASIQSDYECAQLLVAVARTGKVDESLRDAYERAAATIGSDYEYGRAMSAIRRRAQGS